MFVYQRVHPETHTPLYKSKHPNASVWPTHILFHVWYGFRRLRYMSNPLFPSLRQTQMAQKIHVTLRSSNVAGWKSTRNGGFTWFYWEKNSINWWFWLEIMYKWWMFDWNVWLPEGIKCYLFYKQHNMRKWMSVAELMGECHFFCPIKVPQRWHQFLAVLLENLPKNTATIYTYSRSTVK